MGPACKLVCRTFSRPAFYNVSARKKEKIGLSPYDTHYYCTCCHHHWIPHEEGLRTGNSHRFCSCCGNTLRTRSTRNPFRNRAKPVYVIEEGVDF